MNPIESEKLRLSDVGMTGLLCAFSHAIESQSSKPLLADPQAEAIADRLRPVLASSPTRLLQDLARGRIEQGLLVHFALRARKYDGRSVLEHTWMDRLAAEQKGPFLFLAEGLLMYLPPDGVRALVLALQSRFPGSELVFETVNAVWLKPSLKWMIDVKLQKALGLGKGTSYQFGLRDGRELEGWSPGLRFLEEWCYVDEDEPRIGLMRRLRNWKLLRYAQWTVRYLLGPR